ncbi:MAG: hypothetical protein GX591_14830, partial [Planctomycetes bacterium]|nr:hypothetical protein [Planctomycetota bacterium]
MKRSWGKRPAIAAAVAGLLVFGCGASQEPPPEQPAPVYSGSLSDTDPQIADGPRFDLYSIYVAEGDRLCAIMTSTAFDAYLVLLSPSGRTWEDD